VDCLQDARGVADLMADLVAVVPATAMLTM
jgi:hypothetical protein